MPKHKKVKKLAIGGSAVKRGLSRLGSQSFSGSSPMAPTQPAMNTPAATPSVASTPAAKPSVASQPVRTPPKRFSSLGRSPLRKPATPAVAPTPKPATPAAPTTSSTANKTTTPSIRRTPEQALRMAVKREAPDMAFDMNNDQRITSADALALAKRNRDAQTVAQRILKMAVKRETPDMSFDSDGDGKITSRDALSYLKANGFKKGGVVKKASAASKRADGAAVKGKTRGRYI